MTVPTHLVHNVDNVSVGSTVLLQKTLNGGTRGGSVGDGEVTLGVLVLGVDDDEHRVLGGRGRGRDASELTERFGLGHFG
jgi:hypothetical protein